MIPNDSNSYAPGISQKIHRTWKKDRSFRIAIYSLALFIFLALFANLLANDKPFYCEYQGKKYYPFFQEKVFINNTWNLTENIEWIDLPLDYAIWAPVKYGTSTPYLHRVLSPFGPQVVKTIGKQEGKKLSWRNRHWLGTDTQGRDILATIIRGSRHSLGVALFTIILIALIGISLGGLAGYYRDSRLFIKRITAILLIPGIFIAWFYGFYVRKFRILDAGTEIIPLIFQLIISLLIFSGVIWGFLQISKLLAKGIRSEKKIPVKVDTIISRFMETIQSLPGLLLIITLVAFLDSKNVWLVMFILACVSWIGIARVVRAEIMDITERPFVQSLRALGFSNRRIMIKHVLPNSLAPIWPMLAFGIGSVIIAEATLSFLALVEGGDASWGGLITQGKNTRDFWWISFFPGICIFLTVFSFNILGERLRDILDPQAQ